MASIGWRSSRGLLLIMTVLAALIAVMWLTNPSQEAATPGPSKTRETERLVVEVVDSFPHDPGAYTQGLLWYQGHLYESTGQYGSSSIRRVDPISGRVLSAQPLEDQFFGEGLARIGDRLIQLTWREDTALVWDRESLRELSRISYDGEGWGLCFDGHHLVMSDGTSRLTFRNPETLRIEREVEVLLRDGAVGRLNELECVEGWIYANVYTTEWIVRIDPHSGEVAALIDASGLLQPEDRAGTDVLNGIAHDPERGVFYLTGKHWPRLFVVRFVPQEVP